MTKYKICLIAFVATTFSIAAQTAIAPTVKYRRSSLYTLMLDDPSRPYANVIKASFEKGPIPEKFNDHNLGARTMPAANVKDETENVSAFLEANNIARDIVAKWFNRSAKGGFNMDLIAKRGTYDASALDIAKAKATQRGVEALADAGEELIKNTFVLVNDFNYISKEEVAKKVNKWLDVVASATGSSDLVAAQDGLSFLGKGYVVKTTAFLFRLKWDEETAAIFYNDYWADDATITPEKKKAFDESKIFKLELIGTGQMYKQLLRPRKLKKN